MGLQLSKVFLHCMNTQLTSQFIYKTGVQIDKKYVNIIDSNKEYKTEVKEGGISTMDLRLYVNHNWLDIIIAWKSKSCTIYHPSNEDCDCSDLEFWFIDLDATLVVQLLYPGTKPPFKLKGLSYELETRYLQLDQRIQLQLHEAKCAAVPEIMLAIDDFIGKANEKSEKKGRRDGVVHQWKGQQAGSLIIYEIDMGSTGLAFLKKLLQFFSDLNAFNKVVLG